MLFTPLPKALQAAVPELQPSGRPVSAMDYKKAQAIQDKSLMISLLQSGDRGYEYVDVCMYDRAF